MSPLSIGIFTYSTRPRGSVVCAAQLASALHRLGHDVTLYALNKGEDKGEGGFYRSLPCRVRLMRARPAPETGFALIAQRIGEVVEFVERHRPEHDVLHGMDCLVTNGLLESKARGVAGLVVRSVHHVDDFDSDYLNRCQRRSILEADALISVSDATRRDVRLRFGRDSERVHNGVDLDALASFDESAWRRIRKRLGLTEPFVLSVGGIEPRKNSLQQLHAFKCVHAARPELRWVIAGGASIWDHSNYQRQFDAEVRNLPPGAVSLAGVVIDAELVALYHRAAAFLHAASHEGWGLSVLEALAVGTPVVAPLGPPFDEYLDDSCAELVDPSSFLGIAAGLERALDAPPQRRKLAQHQAARWSWASSAEHHVRLYRHWCTAGLLPTTTLESSHA